jgi:hypothetical protein
LLRRVDRQGNPGRGSNSVIADRGGGQRHLERADTYIFNGSLSRCHRHTHLWFIEKAERFVQLNAFSVANGGALLQIELW